jgi:hypothetical protein
VLACCACGAGAWPPHAAQRGVRTRVTKAAAPCIGGIDDNDDDDDACGDADAEPSSAPLRRAALCAPSALTRNAAAAAQQEQQCEQAAGGDDAAGDHDEVAAAEAEEEEDGGDEARAWRCLDERHGASCGRCAPPPSLACGAAACRLWQLRSQKGKRKNGEKLLRGALCRTPEWRSASAREAAAAALTNSGAASAQLLPGIAAALRGRNCSALRKLDMFALCRAWRYKSDVWQRVEEAAAAGGAQLEGAAAADPASAAQQQPQHAARPRRRRPSRPRQPTAQHQAQHMQLLAPQQHAASHHVMDGDAVRAALAAQLAAIHARRAGGGAGADMPPYVYFAGGGRGGVSSGGGARELSLAPFAHAHAHAPPLPRPLSSAATRAGAVRADVALVLGGELRAFLFHAATPGLYAAAAWEPASPVAVDAAGSRRSAALAAHLGGALRADAARVQAACDELGDTEEDAEDDAADAARARLHDCFSDCFSDEEELLLLQPAKAKPARRAAPVEAEAPLAAAERAVALLFVYATALSGNMADLLSPGVGLEARNGRAMNGAERAHVADAVACEAALWRYVRGAASLLERVRTEQQAAGGGGRAAACAACAAVLDTAAALAEGVHANDAARAAWARGRPCSWPSRFWAHAASAGAPLGPSQDAPQLLAAPAGGGNAHY